MMYEMEHCKEPNSKMADFERVALFMFLTFKYFSNAKFYYFKFPDNNGTKHYEHLNMTQIIRICNNRDVICKSNDTEICTMRLKNESVEYKNFTNTCYLFMSNLCDNPSEEYHIVESGPCQNFVEKKFMRRQSAMNKGKIDTTVNTGNKMDTKQVQHSSTTMAPLYEIDTAFDEHICPYSCPDVYSPICLLVNMAKGKDFKFFTFVNHCYGDIFYCKNFDKLGPPSEDDEEDIKSSPLGMSYCGAYRYMQFSRFSEVVSAMGHFGWLGGDQAFSHIMGKAERMPGYG